MIVIIHPLISVIKMPDLKPLWNVNTTKTVPGYNRVKQGMDFGVRFEIK